MNIATHLNRLLTFRLKLTILYQFLRNGTDELINLVLACRACNAYKAFHQLGLHENTEDIPLFNPRQNEWNEHFRINSKTLEIEGLTEIGVGTINRLKMNHIRQIIARNLWNQSEIFP